MLTTCMKCWQEIFVWWKRLTRLSVWVQRGPWVCGHDFYSKTTGGKSLGAWWGIVYSVCGSEEGVWLFLWKVFVLVKVGVPPTTLKVIRSFRDGMRADVRVGKSSTDSIEVNNGLRQGCTLAPTLLNIYYSAVVANWRDWCPSAGVDVRFKHERNLVGDQTAKSRLSVVKATESQFADDTATYPDTFKEFAWKIGEWWSVLTRPKVWLGEM